MKRRSGFATVELPLVLAIFGLLLIFIGLVLKRGLPLLGWPLLSAGTVLCLPFLAFLLLIVFSRK